MYASIFRFIPVLLICLAALAGAVWLLGTLVAATSVSLKVRPGISVVVGGIVAAIAAVYGLWGTASMFDIGAFELRAFSPLWLLDYALFLFEEADFTLEDEDGPDTVLKGYSLVVLWALEAGVFLIAVPFLTARFSARIAKPFCETCGNWYEVEQGFIRLEVPEHSDHLIADTQTTSDLWELPYADFDDDPHIRLDLSGCESCLQGNSVSITVVSYHTANETILDWTPVSENVARHLHERKPGYDEFIASPELDDDEV